MSAAYLHAHPLHTCVPMCGLVLPDPGKTHGSRAAIMMSGRNAPGPDTNSLPTLPLPQYAKKASIGL